MNRNRISASMLFGLILVSVGVISLLGSLGYLVSWDVFSTYWPIVIILLGLRHIINPGGGKLWGLILMVVGTLVQLEILDVFMINRSLMRDMAIPVIIILIGLRFMLPGGRKNNVKQDQETLGRAQTQKTEVPEPKATSHETTKEKPIEEAKVKAPEPKPETVNTADVPIETVDIETVEVETVEVIVDKISDADETVIEIEE